MGCNIEFGVQGICNIGMEGKIMRYPTIEEAEALLNEAAGMNPGEWVAHNQVAGLCASMIASNCAGMDEQKAYVLGLLHDIGRRFGNSDLKHVIYGYKFMLEKKYEDCARICLTHSFPYKDIRSYNGQNDCQNEESNFLQNYIDTVEYDEYDKLIQLCDAMAYPTGPCLMEKKLVDVVMRKGFNDLTIPKWKEFFKIKTFFEEKMNCKLEDLFQ